MSSEQAHQSRVTRKAAYSLAAGAVATAAASDAEAQIIWSSPQDISINQFGSLLLDIEGDIGYGTTYDATLKNYVFGGGNYQGLTINYAPGRAVGFQGTFPYISLLNPGDLIDEAATSAGVTSGSMAYGTNNPAAEFNDVQAGYLGLSFPINSFPHFGWIRLTIDNDAGVFIVHDWAYNSSTEVVTDENGDPVLDPFGDPIRIGLPILAGQTAGDYNGDGFVNAADYTVYRDTLGSTEDLRADGDGDGVITEDGTEIIIDDEPSFTPGDLAIWREDYGFSSEQPSAPIPSVPETTSVPEPCTLGLLACGAAGLGVLRRRDSRRVAAQVDGTR